MTQADAGSEEDADKLENASAGGRSAGSKATTSTRSAASKARLAKGTGKKKAAGMVKSKASSKAPCCSSVAISVMMSALGMFAGRMTEIVDVVRQASARTPADSADSDPSCKLCGRTKSEVLRAMEKWGRCSL